MPYAINEGNSKGKKQKRTLNVEYFQIFYVLQIVLIFGIWSVTVHLRNFTSTPKRSRRRDKIKHLDKKVVGIKNNPLLCTTNKGMTFTGISLP